MRRLLVYSHDTFGLGNIRRILSICDYLIQNDPQLNILLLSGSPVLHHFPIPERTDYIKLPSLTRTQSGDYDVKTLDSGIQEIVAMRAQILRTAVAGYRPDVFLVDKKPLGVEQELRSALEYVRTHHPQIHMTLLLRDVLDTPEQTNTVWEKHGYHDVIKQFYQSILVVGSKDIYNLSREYRFPASSAEKVTFCGYIQHRAKPGCRTRIRQELKLKQEPLVLVTPGGGEDGYQLLDTFVQGLPLLPTDFSHHSVIITGPEMPVIQKQQIYDKVANYSHVTVLDFTADLIDWIDAADIVVSMGGYNTVCEVLSLKKKAIVVPRIRPVQEQLIRAQRMASYGLLTMIHPAELHAKGLINCIQRLLKQENVRHQELYKLDFQGLPRIAKAINTEFDDTTFTSDPTALSQTHIR